MTILIRCMLLVPLLFACASGKTPVSDGLPVGELEDWQTYEQVRTALDTVGAEIDYDTLMFVYKSLVSAEKPVAHMDQLLFDLIEKRNSDPRLDQAIIILAAHIIGQSAHPIPRVSLLFDTILQMDDSRITNWVMIIVAEALGDYPVDLPDGDRLAGLVEAQVEQAYQAHDPSKERFGQHLLPPPKRKAIIDYIAGIEDQRTRQWERETYYWMIRQNYSEEKIEAGLGYVLTHRLPGMDVKDVWPLGYLFQNWDEVQAAVSASMNQ